MMPYYLPDGITGGAEKQAYLLAKELAKRGHPVLFLCLNPKGREEVSEREGVLVVRRLRRMGKLQFLDYPLILRELLRWKPDVVISRMRFYYLPNALYALAKGKVSVAFVPENFLTQPFPEFRRTLRLVRPTLKAPLYLAHALALDIFSQVGLLLSKLVIVQNDVQMANLRRFFLRSSVKLPSIFVPPDTMAAKEAEPLIVWVGNAREEKAPDVFVSLAERLPEYRFVMVGRRTERFNGALPNLRATGELPHVEALRWIGRAWVLVNTSYEEGFPNVFLEAWYLKTLVLTFWADPDNLVASGLGIKAGNVEEAASALKAVLGDRETMEEITEKAHRYVLETHTPEVVVPRFLKLLHHLT